MASKKIFQFLLLLLVLLIFTQNSFGFPPFKFAVIADPHLSVPGPHSPKNGVKMFKESVALLKATINEINKRKDINFVLVLGDLTKDAEPWNLDKFKEVMSELKVPYYVVLGNHDISPVDIKATNRDPGVSRSTMIWAFQGHGFKGPKANWSLDPIPGVHLIGLDSTMTGDWAGRLTKEGLEFLKKDLAANPDKITIVILHHQLQPYTKAEITGENNFNKFVLLNASEVKDILNKNPQVIMTLSGHRHLSTRYILENNIAYFTCPSTVTWPMRYVIFSVDNKGISYQTYDVPTSKKVWETARKFAFDTNTTQWPRTSETPNTPEGNKKFIKIMKADNLKDGYIPMNKVLPKATP
ncbi:metallophosphoesterase [Thermodesulfatator indicus DSM 15286]|uniref:Metallophosphoesterase n=1 Tax=Thermodesulfatator indicus (strain DSM 15286 / JCM 11887 / CIR29812) TaxID=667014 RepID=F8A995_THEID|nr:metallophosphoesterase [Thermodesulfatator indicus]AEH45354.1 metallophosphoesterase [Thermodesulfatator indicus DSM 15286]